MNCKQGDLALIVKTGQEYRKYLGRIVQCVKKGPTLHGFETWIVEPDLGVDACEDVCLRPLRDSDGQDETLT